MALLRQHMFLWQSVSKFKHLEFTSHAHSLRHVAMPTDRLWKPFIVAQQMSWMHKPSDFFIINRIIVLRFCMNQVFTHLALAYGGSCWNIWPYWPGRSTCIRACLQTPPSSLYICLLEDILSRWTKSVTPQVHDERPAQNYQPPEQGWTFEESLKSLCRLLAISIDEKKLLKEQSSVWIELLGRLGGKLEC